MREISNLQNTDAPTEICEEERRMNDPIVVRINKFMTRDDFRHASEELKRDNPNIIVLPAEYELLYPDVIPVTRCKDCENHGTRTNMCSIWHHHTNAQGFCHRAKAVKKNDTE